MGGRPGLRVCPGVFKTTIILKIVRDSSIPTFLLFIFFPFCCLCLVAANMFWHLAFPLKLRAGPVFSYGV